MYIHVNIAKGSGPAKKKHGNFQNKVLINKKGHRVNDDLS